MAPKQKALKRRLSETIRTKAASQPIVLCNILCIKGYMAKKFVPLGIRVLKGGCHAVTLATSEPWLRMVCTGTARGTAEMKYVGLFIDTLRAMMDQSYRLDELLKKLKSAGCRQPYQATILP